MLRWPNGRGRNGGEKGQSVVEFALVLPIFVLLLFGIVEFGLALFNDITLTNAAREGARLGSVHPPTTVPSSPCYGFATLDDCIEARVLDTADPLVNCGPEASVTNANGLKGESVVVEVSCEYGFITPLGNVIGLITGGSFSDSVTISSEADMRLE